MHIPLKTLTAFRVYLEPSSLRMVALGFAAGLPVLLILGTLGFWLRESGVDRTTIGYASWVGMVYALKWMWAPLVDRLPIPGLTSALGRRRSWLLCAQLVVILGLVIMASHNPQTSLSPVAYGALLVAWGSATQDIALDAFRIESASTDLQAALAASYQTGYRLAMIWAGAGVLWIVAQTAGTSGYQYPAWRAAYLVMAASMGLGSFTVLMSPEPRPIAWPPARNLGAWLRGALIEPLAEFARRYRWQAALVLALIATYRISDVVMGIMANPFYVDMGYSKEEVVWVTKVFGAGMTLAGAFVGGVLVLRLGMMRVLTGGAVLSAASNLLFAALSTRGHDVIGLVMVICADNLSSGIASAAFVAYLSSLTHVNYSATQYAVLSSMMLLLPKFLAGYSGYWVDHFGYSNFFVATALLGVPVLGLLYHVNKMAKSLY